jgi:5'-nucleotidase
VNILVTNDDGVYAPGLWAGVSALSDIGDVVVVAPDRDQSGRGPSVTLDTPVRVKRGLRVREGIETYAVEGTPGDSVILAVENLMASVDLVVSGVNNGANLGDDVFVSGTVGAAIHGYFRGIPSIAISIASPRASDFRPAEHVLARLAEMFADGLLPKSILLNVNIPPIHSSKIEGIDLTRLAGRRYADTVRGENDWKGGVFYWITRSRPAWDVEEGTDAWSVLHNRISITPLQMDLTSKSVADMISGLPGKLSDSFQSFAKSS